MNNETRMKTARLIMSGKRRKKWMTQSLQIITTKFK